MEFLSRDVVERVAKIIGKNSAAAKALKKAEEYEEPIFFKEGSIIGVMEGKYLRS